MIDDEILDDADQLIGLDSQRMLASTASAGAAIRLGLDQPWQDLLGGLVEQGRPRSLCVVGAGGSSTPGEVLAAVTGRGSAVPVFAMGGPSLPGWVGPMDWVVAVSASGRTPETLTFVQEAQRRGCSVLGIGASESPLHELCSRTRGVAYWPVTRRNVLGDAMRARSLFWALSTPLVLLGGQMGLVTDAAAGLEQAADQLDARATTFGPEVGPADNPAKLLAIELTAGLPVVWGSGDVGTVAARRLGRQLAENADWPSIVGSLPEAARTHAGLLRGPWAAEPSADDIFRDRTDDDGPQARLRVLLLRDQAEHPETRAVAEAIMDTCQRRDVPLTAIDAVGEHPLAQLADLIAIVDFASVYAALIQGRDPSPSAGDVDPRFGRVDPRAVGG